MRKKLLIILAMILSFSLFGCTTDDGIDPNKETVAVSIVPQAAFVEAIAGDTFNIITLIPPGYSPGNYDPSAKTMAYLEDALVYFTIGVPTEATNIIADPQVTNLNIVNLETIVAATYPDLTIDGAGRDPHTWLSIKRVKVMVQAMSDELQRLDPENASLFESNTEAYLDQLDTLNQQIIEIFADKTMKTFIVFHPAFGYFADEYDLDMITIEEGGKEATPTRLQEVIDAANENDIHHVFIQAEFDSSQVAAFADEIDGEIVELIPLSEDYLNNLINMANSIAGALR